MMSLKKLVCSAALLFTAATASLSANAGLITQQVRIGGELIATIDVGVDSAAIGDMMLRGDDITRLGNIFEPELFSLESFTFLGEALDVVDDVFAFEFERDFSSPTNGFDFLFFDINTTALGEELAVSFNFDSAFPMDSSLEFFTPEGVFFGGIFADEGVEFSVVPEPSVLSVFALGMMLLLTARRQRR